MMGETSAGRSSHETSTGSFTPRKSSEEHKDRVGLTQAQRYAIEYKTAISASIGAAASAVVG